MPKSISSCIKVSDTQICPYCYSSKIVKNGHTKTRKQQYLCNSCSKRFLDYHTYNACKPETNSLIIAFTKEGMGVRSIARILAISATTLLKRYITIAENIQRPILLLRQQYEVDELNFYNGNKDKRIWLVCALDQRTKQIVSFNIGKRTNKTLNHVIKTLKNSKAQKIYTDRLHNYRTLIPKEIHSTKRYGTNYIERENLNIRTFLKRFSRKTICFSRSILVTEAILKIYFWA